MPSPSRKPVANHFLNPRETPETKADASHYKREVQSDPFNWSATLFGNRLTRCPKCQRLIKRRTLWGVGAERHRC